MPSINDITHLGEREICQKSAISLFSRMGDKGEGRRGSNLKKWVTPFIDGPILHTLNNWNEVLKGFSMGITYLHGKVFILLI